MSDYESLSRNYATAGAQTLKPLTREASEALGLTEQAQQEELGYFLAKAFMAGITAGESEVMAQAAEQGANINVEQLRPPD